MARRSPPWQTNERSTNGYTFLRPFAFPLRYRVHYRSSIETVTKAPKNKSVSGYWESMSNTLSGDLPALWRARAETLSTYGDPNSARLWNIAATELERAMESSAAETLSLADASRICGYSAAYLSALIKHGKIPNAGRTHAPRIRRQDLPPKKQPGGRGRPANQNADGRAS